MPKINLNNTPNAKMIKNVQEKSVTLSNAKTVQDIPLELIDENADNDKIFNMEDVERLAENIKQEGFFGTIELYQKPDGRYEISSGHRRFRAMKLLKRPTIPSTITPMPELDTKKRRKLIASNINSRNMTPLDCARAIQYYIDTLQLEDAQSHGKEINKENTRYRSVGINTDQEAAKYFDKDPVTINRYKRLNNLIPELQKMIEDNVLPWTSICEAGNLSKEYQQSIYNDLQNILAHTSPTEDEEGNPKTYLSGQQVTSVVSKYKRIISEERRREKEEKSAKKDNKPESEDNKTLVMPLDLENDLDLPVYSDKNSKSLSKENYISPIDGAILSLRQGIEVLINREYRIDDKKAVKESIFALEKLLAQLKKQL